MTGAQSHFAGIVDEPRHRRTLEALLNGAGPQQQTEKLLMVHLQVGLSGRSKHLDCDLHLCLTPYTLWDGRCRPRDTSFILENSERLATNPRIQSQLNLSYVVS